jgi:hypothetical protein
VGPNGDWEFQRDVTNMRGLCNPCRFTRSTVRTDRRERGPASPTPAPLSFASFQAREGARRKPLRLLRILMEFQTSKFRIADMEIMSSLLFASEMLVAALAIVFVAGSVATGSIIVLILCDLTSRKNEVVAATSEAENQQPISSLAERLRERRERLYRSREDGSRVLPARTHDPAVSPALPKWCDESDRTGFHRKLKRALAEADAGNP